MESNPNDQDLDAEDLSKFMEEQTIKESSMNLGQFVSEEMKDGDECKLTFRTQTVRTIDKR